MIFVLQIGQTILGFKRLRLLLFVYLLQYKDIKKQKFTVQSFRFRSISNLLITTTMNQTSVSDFLLEFQKLVLRTCLPIFHFYLPNPDRMRHLAGV